MNSFQRMFSTALLLGIAALLALGYASQSLAAAETTATPAEIASDGWPMEEPWHHYPYRYQYAYPQGRPLNYNNNFSYLYNYYYFRYYVYPNTNY
jgi:hypothetical protein